MKRTLADLRPNATITCFYCGKVKPQAGSRKFRAHHVCADCIKELNQKETK